MTRRNKFLFGGLGAVAPLVIGLATKDPATVFASFSVTVFAGYLVRFLFDFACGGAWVHFQDTEGWKPIKIIQLGFIAPLSIAAFFSSKAATPPAERHASLSITSPVYAGEPDQRIGRFKQESFADDKPSEFLRGFTKTIPPDLFFIVGTEHEDVQKVHEFAEKMFLDLDNKGLFAQEKGRPSLTVKIYEPYKSLKWTLVFGEKLNHADADYLLGVLLRNDFKGARLWDLNCECFLDEVKKE